MKEGESPTQIARFLGCSRAAIYRWKAKEQAEGEAGLAAKPHPGRQPSLSAEQVQQLEELLKQGPPAHGWKTGLWSASRVTAMIERHFGVKLHPEHVRKILRKKLVWTSQRPQKKARERHEEQIQRWRKRTFGRIKKGSSANSGEPH